MVATWSRAMRCSTRISGDSSRSMYEGLDVQHAFSIISGPSRAPVPPAPPPPPPALVPAPPPPLLVDFSYAARPSKAYLLTHA